MITIEEAIRKVTKEEYISEMYSRDRIFVMLDKFNNLIAVATFCITDNPKDLIRDEPWSLPEDNPNGKYFVFDRLVSGLKDKRKYMIIGRELIRRAKHKYPNKTMLWFSRRKENAIYC